MELALGSFRFLFPDMYPAGNTMPHFSGIYLAKTQRRKALASSCPSIIAPFLHRASPSPDPIRDATLKSLFVNRYSLIVNCYSLVITASCQLPTANCFLSSSRPYLVAASPCSLVPTKSEIKNQKSKIIPSPSRNPPYPVF